MSYYSGRNGYAESQPVSYTLMQKLEEAADRKSAATKRQLESLAQISGPVENDPVLDFSQAVGGGYVETQPSVCPVVIAEVNAVIAARKAEQRAAILNL